MVIGFGINVNNCDFPHELEDLAVSMKQLLGKEVDLKKFTLDFIAKLVWNLGLLYFIEARRPRWHEESQTFVHPIIERWKGLSDTLGKKVVYGYDVLTKPQYHAEVKGIAGDGGLQMILPDGSTITEHSGEIRYVNLKTG